MPSYREISEVLGRNVAELVESHEKLAAFHNSKASSYLKPYYEAKMAEVELSEEKDYTSASQELIESKCSSVHLHSINCVPKVIFTFMEQPDEAFFDLMFLYQSNGCLGRWYGLPKRFELTLNPILNTHKTEAAITSDLLDMGYEVITGREY